MAILIVALLFFLLVPSFSLFSMRQVQELAVTLCLSTISLLLLLVSVLQGASSVWRDVEKRYTSSLLGLPVSRATFVVAKFAGIAVTLVCCTMLLGALALPAISISAAQYPSDIPIHWMNIIGAIGMDCLKYILLSAVALFLSTVSTSFFFPFFGSVAIFFAGSASQEVIEYISGDYGKSLTPAAKLVINIVYYLLPNFSAFNLKVAAIYGLPFPFKGALYTFLYFIVYTSILLCLSVWSFTRRELP
ncbi:ABC transporter permease [Geobacter hydrogenophilus]|uniref:ABC transporter permease n=1 Tax=Geobacter hydrogenophilus TaxID=40983 RepID=UPI0035A25763